MPTPKWDDFETAIREILGAAKAYNPKHHFGRPFVWSYQIAIELSERAEFANLKTPVGGKGIGQHNSLAQYISGQLSKRIKNGDIRDIEGAFLYRKHVRTVVFKKGKTTIESTVQPSFDAALFRLRGAS